MRDSIYNRKAYLLLTPDPGLEGEEIEFEILCTILNAASNGQKRICFSRLRFSEHVILVTKVLLVSLSGGLQIVALSCLLPTSQSTALPVKGGSVEILRLKKRAERAGLYR